MLVRSNFLRFIPGLSSSWRSNTSKKNPDVCLSFKDRADYRRHRSSRVATAKAAAFLTEARLLNISRWPKADMRWYLGVRCQHCHTPILFALDHTDGAKEGLHLSSGKLVLTCPLDECRHQADYTAAAVSRFQGMSSKPNQTGWNNENSKNRKRKR